MNCILMKHVPMEYVFTKIIYFTASLLFTYHLAFAQETSKESAAEKRAQSSVASSAFKALYDGKEVIFNTVLAYTYGGQGLRVVLSTAQPKCKDLDGFVRVMSHNEKRLSMTVAPLLSGDGSSSWRIRTLYFTGRNAEVIDEVGEVSMKSGDISKDFVQFKLDHTIDFKANDFLKRRKGTMILKGTVNARSCGAFKRHKEAASKPQRELKVTLAEHPINIRGAVIRYSRESAYLTLASQPIDCQSNSTGGSEHAGSDLFLEFELSRNGKFCKFLLANGDLIRSNVGIGFDDVGLGPNESSFTLTGPEGYLTEVGEHKVAIESQISLRGLPLSIHGHVVVTTCGR